MSKSGDAIANNDTGNGCFLELGDGRPTSSTTDVILTQSCFCVLKLHTAFSLNLDVMVIHS
jgi:hypothetical protein